jgi:hypothetical protein
MISTLIALPYEIARLPLAVVDDKLLDRLPESSAPRVVLDRTLGSADKVAGALLRNPGIAQRGAERVERSTKLATAARLEKKADARREQAAETGAAGRKEAAQKREAARDRAVSAVVEAEEAEIRGKQQAEAEAERTAAAKKAAADQRAAVRTEQAEKRKASVTSAAEAKKKASQRRTKSELDDARESKKSAAEERADAERLSELTDAKKKARKQG